MGKYNINNEMLKEFLELDVEFNNVNDLCDYLVKNIDKSTTQRVGIRNMLMKKIVAENREERKFIQQIINPQEVIEWIRKNCIFENEQEAEFVPEIKIISEDISEKCTRFVSEMDFQKIKSEYENSDYEKVQQLDSEDVDYTEGIVLLEEGIITKQNEYQLIFEKSNIELDLSKVLIVELEGNRVLALGYLVPDEKNRDAYTMVFENRDLIDYSAFIGVTQARIVIYTKKGSIYSRVFDMEYKPFEIEKNRPLCIDFGTSNTTVGSYGILNRKKDEAEIVKFIDVTVNPNNTESVLLPTIVYVDDCSDKDNIKYLFGYEAQKKIEDEHYESKASVYYEIKRWISAPDIREEIRDQRNNKAEVSRKKIIKSYIDYVIKNAEQYFGTRFEKIHFSSPVKLKEQFINVFTELYKGEKQILDAEQSIDEGIAIVYNQIIALIDSGSNCENTKKSIMIMDCGGGTTDLASCEYQYRKTETGRELELDTCFENGNSNFGGNNITYRIMQLLKIKIAAVMSQNIIDHMGDAISLINKSENDILGIIERNMEQRKYDSDKADNDIYTKFLENYERAESIIPTQYTENKKYHGTESLKKIKRNFYYLWRQAEQIKIEFYKTERVLMNFTNTEGDSINVKTDDNYYLYVDCDNELKKIENPFNKISITIKEINRVICGDVYALLVGLFQSGQLTSRKINVDEFDYYKLSGQSCKISLFSELIKEYIPGRKFRPAIKMGTDTKRSSEDLKLDCVLGCISYVKDQNRPEMNIISKPRRPEFIYSIVLKGNHNKNRKLFDCDNLNLILMEVSHKNTKEYPLMVVGKDGTMEREFIFELRNPGEKDPVSSEKNIMDKIKDYCSSVITDDIIQEFVSEKLKNVVTQQNEVINIVFAVPAKKGYGVWICQIQADSNEDCTEYKVLKFQYENFEDSSKSFFDGSR